MSAIPFINNTNKTKFQGSFHFDSNNYEYTIYLLPIKKRDKKQINEIIDYFGNRQFKGSICLEVDEDAVASYIDDKNVSAFFMVNPVGVDNVASGTIQIFDWCINPPNFSSSSIKSTKSASTKSTSNSAKPQNMDEADAWINDVCRVSSSGNTGNPLKALFFLMEQLVVQNLGKTNIKLYITPEPDNVAVLKPKYESLGFIKNFTDTPDICPNWKGHEIVMEKTGLTPEQSIIDFSFLEGKQLTKSIAKSVARRTTRRTSIVTAKGIKNKTHKRKRKYHKRK